MCEVNRMNITSVIEKGSQHLVRTVVACIRQATDDDIKRYLAEFRPGTINGLPHQIHDWINGHLRDHIDSNDLYTLEIKRCGWRGRLIIDKTNKIVYSIMRIDRLNTLRKEKRNKPHYLQTIVGVLNTELEANNKQMNLDEYANLSFSNKELKDDFSQLFGTKITPSEGYKHCLVLFATRNLELYDVRLCVVDRDLDVVEDKSLVEFINPDYSVLTGTNTNYDNKVAYDDSETNEDNSSADDSLVRLKVIKKPSTD